jgi:hypothetical protein
MVDIGEPFALLSTRSHESFSNPEGISGNSFLLPAFFTLVAVRAMGLVRELPRHQLSNEFAF